MRLKATLFILLVAVSTRAQQRSHAKVDAIFENWDTPDTPGCALSVIRDGAITYKRGYGMANLEYGIPITPSSIFHVASVSKHFTVMAILLLSREGTLSLDDDVRKSGVCDRNEWRRDLQHRTRRRLLGCCWDGWRLRRVIRSCQRRC